MTDVWEPWSPKPGDRVRVRLSAECRRPHPRPPDPTFRGVDDYPLPATGHCVELDGEVGMVGCFGPFKDYAPDEDAPGHRYVVYFDRGVLLHQCPARRVLVTSDTFAATEIEPL